MYTPRSSRVVFSAISQDLHFRCFSLYHRSVSDASLLWPPAS